jgi:hypothetical protein
MEKYYPATQKATRGKSHEKKEIDQTLLEGIGYDPWRGE